MIFSYLTVCSGFSSEARKLIRENIIGTPGISMQYQHLETEKKINTIPEPFVAELRKGKSLRGTCCFCKRETTDAGKKHHAFYLRYFTFLQSFRSRPSLPGKRPAKKSLIREEIQYLLQGKGLFQDDNRKFYHYAYVDRSNERSYRLCREFGFEPVRKLSTFFFHRFNPISDPSVSVIIPEEKDIIEEKLKAFYRNHTMFSEENLLKTGKYFVLRDDAGDIIAGVQAETDHWKILGLKSPAESLMLKSFSHLPFFSKILSTDFRFVCLENLFCEPGREKMLDNLFEAVLHHFRLHTALLWLDGDTFLYHALQENKSGVLAKLQKPHQGEIICRFINFTESEKQRFRDNPAYISGRDLT